MAAPTGNHTNHSDTQYFSGTMQVGSIGSGYTALTIYTKSALDLAEVAANTSAEQAVTVTGVASGDLVLAALPQAALEAGLVASHARVSGANTVQLTMGNHTAAPINPAAADWKFVVLRPA